MGRIYNIFIIILLFLGFDRFEKIRENAEMTNLFDVLKPKDDNLALGTVGASVDTAGTKAATKKAPKNIVAASANESPAAAAARERAEAAKAQIEMRKAAEAQRRAAEERKALEESARKHMSESNGKTAPASAAAEAAKSFELKPPIKRPKSASVNHAQYIAEEREKGKIVEEDPISAETRKAKAKVSAAQIEERKAIQRSETAAKKAEDALKAVEAANAALAEAEKLELEAQSAVKEVEADTLDSIHKAEVAREEAMKMLAYFLDQIGIDGEYYSQMCVTLDKTKITTYDNTAPDFLS